MTEVKELKEMKEVLVATNQYDVDIAKVKAEIGKLSIELGSRFQLEEMIKKEETAKFKQVVSSVENILFGGMVLTGYIYAINKRSETTKYVAEYANV